MAAAVVVVVVVALVHVYKLVVVIFLIAHRDGKDKIWSAPEVVEPSRSLVFISSEMSAVKHHRRRLLPVDVVARRAIIPPRFARVPTPVRSVAIPADGNSVELHQLCISRRLPWKPLSDSD